MTDPGVPHDPLEGGNDRPSEDPRRSSWSGFPGRDRSPQPSSSSNQGSAPPDDEPIHPPSAYAVEAPGYEADFERDPDTDPEYVAPVYSPGPSSAVPAAHSAAPVAVAAPEFRPSERAPRPSRRLDEERRLSDEITPLNYFTRRTGILDVLVAFLFIALGYFSVILTYTGFGHAWDEALYLKGSLRAAEWARGVSEGQKFLLTPEGIENDWGGRFEGELHPEVGPVPKLVTGLGSLLLPDRGVPPVNAGRIPVAAAFGLTLALLYLMGTAEYGRLGGFAATLAYLLMPRVFGHAHMAASETLLAFAVAFTTWAYLAGLVRWPLALLLTAPAFALALGTKVNAFFLPIPLLIWGQLYRRRDYGSNVFAMLIVAPLLLAAIWPWLWHGGPQKLLSFLEFYVTHQSTAVWFQGQKWGYGRPSAPWYYPFLITLIVVPLWIAVLAAIGMLRALLQFLSRPVPILFLLMGLTFLGISALPSSPKYDGERLFFPAFMFIALLAGGGFSGLAAIGRETALASHNRPGTDTRIIIRSQNFLFSSILFGLVVWGTFVVYRSHPNELNFYNWFTDGTKGAEDKGFETSYWGEALNDEVTQWLTKNVEPGQKVKVLALEGLAFKHLQDWGHLPEDVDFAPEAPPFDWYILQNRKGFFGNMERTLFSRKPFKSFEVDGVPRILVYSGDTLPLEAPKPPEPPQPAPVAPAAPAPADGGTTESVQPDEATTETAPADATGTTEAAPVVEAAPAVDGPTSAVTETVAPANEETTAPSE